MPPQRPPVLASTRRAKRMIESSSESSVPPESDDGNIAIRRTSRGSVGSMINYREEEDDDDEEKEEEEEEDAEGEEEEGMDLESEEEAGDRGVSTAPPSEDVLPETAPQSDEEYDFETIKNPPSESIPQSKGKQPVPTKLTSTKKNMNTNTKTNTSTTTPKPNSAKSATPSSVPKIKLKFGLSGNVNAGPSAPGSGKSVASTGKGGKESKTSSQKAKKKGKKSAAELAASEEETPEPPLFDEDLEPTDEVDGDLDEDGEFDDEFDQEMDVEGSGTRSISPTKLTARQRSKQNKDLLETLIELPETQGKNKLILTETERLERKEELARRRKRQSEQKLQDEQDQTINRLLRAQTGRSRAKLDGDDTGGTNTPLQLIPSGPPILLNTTAQSRRNNLPKPGMLRYISTTCPSSTSIEDGDNGTMRNLLGIPNELNDYFVSGKRKFQGGGGGGERGCCAVPGCGGLRKYRMVSRFEVGACGIEHLKVLEAGS